MEINLKKELDYFAFKEIFIFVNRIKTEYGAIY